MIVTRRTLRVRVRAPLGEPHGLQAVYIPIVPVLRSLGAKIRFDARRHRLDVRFSAGPAILPFSPSVQQTAPAVVFTPEPIVTPRPLYTGSPHPRRTPIVVTTSRP